MAKRDMNPDVDLQLQYNGRRRISSWIELIQEANLFPWGSLAVLAFFWAWFIVHQVGCSSVLEIDPDGSGGASGHELSNH